MNLKVLVAELITLKKSINIAASKQKHGQFITKKHNLVIFWSSFLSSLDYI